MDEGRETGPGGPAGPRRRVVVTGLGAVSAFGAGAPTFWEACLAGRTVVEAVPDRWRDHFDPRSTLWSPLGDLDPLLEPFSRTERAQNDPVALLAGRAAHEAIGMAGWEPVEHNRRARTLRIPGLDPHRAGVFIGTGVGGVSSFLRNHAHHLLERPVAALAGVASDLEPDTRARLESGLDRLAAGRRFNPFVVSMLMPNAPGAFVSVKYGLNGPCRASTAACAAGTVAIGQAFRAVRDGEVDVALAGGTEYLDDPHGGIFRGFDVAGALVRDCTEPDRANRPFDERRSGFLFSQGGAAVLMLEEAGHAAARGVPVLAEVAGYGETFDAHSMMSIAPDGDQIERMIRAALDDAGVGVADVDHVNAHGTGTEANDVTECEVIGRVLGERVMVNSTKSLIGHTLGASGALEAVVTVLGLRDQTTHPCRALERPLPGLDFVREPGPRRIDVALSESFAFGGHNAALVFRRAGAG